MLSTDFSSLLWNVAVHRLGVGRVFREGWSLPGTDLYLYVQLFVHVLSILSTLSTNSP